jgi:hypothetical protein
VPAATSINSTMASVEVLDQKYYAPIDQSDHACFFLPELPPGEPVILFGQCDRNISVVENFNATRVSISLIYVLVLHGYIFYLFDDCVPK